MPPPPAHLVTCCSSWKVLCSHKWTCGFLTIWQNASLATSWGRGSCCKSCGLASSLSQPLRWFLLNFPRILAPAPSGELHQKSFFVCFCPVVLTPQASWGRRGGSPGVGGHAPCDPLWSSVPKHPVCTLSAAGAPAWNQLLSAGLTSGRGVGPGVSQLICLWGTLGCVLLGC